MSDVSHWKKDDLNKHQLAYAAFAVRYLAANIDDAADYLPGGECESEIFAGRKIERPDLDMLAEVLNHLSKATR